MSDAEGWYMAEGDQPVGPFSLDALKRKIQAGKLTRANLVYHDSVGWKETRGIPELEEVFKELLGVSSSTTSQPGSPTKTVAASIDSKSRVKKFIAPAVAVFIIAIAAMIFSRELPPVRPNQSKKLKKIKTPACPKRNRWRQPKKNTSMAMFPVPLCRM